MLTRHARATYLPTQSLYRPRSVCRVTSGKQLKRAATALVPTPRDVYPVILPCRHGPDARRRGVRPLVTMGMPHGRFRQRSRHGPCSIARGMGYIGPRREDWLDGMRWVRLGSCFGTE